MPTQTESVSEIVHFVWGSCGFFVLLREGGPPAWLLTALYLLPLLFPAVRPLRAVFLSSWSVPLAYALAVAGTGLLCAAIHIAHGISSAVRPLDLKIYSAEVLFWPVTSLAYVVLFLLVVSIVRHLRPHAVAY